MPEKRRSVRVKRHHLVSEEGRLYRTLDISRDGMLLESTSPPPIGALVEFRIALGEHVVVVRGRVVRHVPLPGNRTGVGLQLENLDPGTRMLLAISLVK